MLFDKHSSLEHTARAFGLNRMVWGLDGPAYSHDGGTATWVTAKGVFKTGRSTAEHRAQDGIKSGTLWRIRDAVALPRDSG